MKRTAKYLYILLCMILLCTLPVCAYIDPSVMTYGIQVIAGVAVVVGTVVGVLWRKAKKKVQNSLGIDENANKEVEEDVVFEDDDE